MSRLSTANVILLTATPGSGKTLRAIEMMREEQQAGTLVYSCNIKGMRLPGVLLWDDPAKWRDLPAGSILFVDEAQRFFRKSQGPIPEYITAMETMRHSGHRIVFITQQPGYLHPHILGLCGRHEHLVRKYGMKRAYIFRSEEVQENTKSLRSRISADTETWKFPEDCYQYYDSAEVHTHKFQLPSKMKKGIAFAAIALLLFGAFGWRFYRTAIAPAVQEAETAGDVASVSAPQAPPSSAPSSSSQFVAPTTPEGWAEAMTPTLPGLMYTAPIFAKALRVQAQPRSFCVVSGGDYRNTEMSRCTCYTEQGTKIAGVNQTQCRSLAVTGYYDPFRAPAVASGQAASSVGSVESGRAGPSGLRTSPSSVGSPRQGDVWGVPPVTVRAGGG